MISLGSIRHRTRKSTSIVLIRVFGELNSDQSNILDIMQVLLNHDCSGYRGVILLIDCSGGTLASAEGLEALLQMRFRDAGVSIYAVVLERCLSAGMHLACFADRIYAPSGALFGSFGTSMEWPESHLLRKKVGLSRTLYKTRPYKDLCSPHRPPTPDDQKRVMELLNRLDSQFLEFICERRGLHRKDIESFLDGRLITAADALKIGLIDEFGGIGTACARLVPGFPLLTDVEVEFTFLGEPKSGSPQLPLLAEISKFFS